MSSRTQIYKIFDATMNNKKDKVFDMLGALE